MAHLRCSLAFSGHLWRWSLPPKRPAETILWTRRLVSTGEGAGRSGGARVFWLYAMPATAFCLGTWQVYRLQWKRGLISQLESRTIQPPISLPHNVLERLDELEYRRVHLHGFFDHSRELYVWPRTCIADGDDAPREGHGRGRGGGAVGGARGPQPGAFVITPFHCKETECQILVNRGWVSRKKMHPSTRPEGQMEGEMALTAIVRKTEKRMPFAPRNDDSNNHWNYKDIDGMSQVAGTEPILVDADATTTVPGGPIGGQTRVNLRNEHLQYIITWYGLSLATFYLARQFMKGKMFR